MTFFIIVSSFAQKECPLPEEDNWFESFISIFRYNKHHAVKKSDLKKTIYSEKVSIEQIKEEIKNKNKNSSVQLFGFNFSIPMEYKEDIEHIFQFNTYRNNCCGNIDEYLYSLGKLKTTNCCEQAMSLKNKKIEKIKETMQSCSPQIECLLEKAFPGNNGYLTLFLKNKYNLNRSDYYTWGDENMNFTEDELDKVYETFSELPLSLFQHTRESSFEIHKAEGTNEKLTIAAALGSKIMLYPKWIQKTSNESKYTLLHEIGHTIDTKFIEEYKKLPFTTNNPYDRSDKRNFKKYEKNKKLNSVSKYSRESVKENFAEAFTQYRYAPKRLKRLSPEKYEFFKNKVFNNIEFIDN